MRKIRILIASQCLALVFGLVLSAYAWGQAVMYVKISGRHMVEVMDRNCGDRIIGRFTVVANQAVTVPVCRSNAGYGNIAIRNISNNGRWNGSGLLREGDTVYP